MQIVFSANKLTQLNYPQQKNSFVSFKGVKVNEDNNSSNSSKSFVDDWREHLKNPLEVSFVEEFSKKIENIKKECDDKIRATKDSIFDFFNSKGKERARLKAEREVALAAARECQEIFEKSELKVIELKKEYLKLAKELNLSKERKV